MYRKLEDFINDWTYESESTLKVFNNLTDESLTKKIEKIYGQQEDLPGILQLLLEKWLIAQD